MKLKNYSKANIVLFAMIQILFISCVSDDASDSKGNNLGDNDALYMSFKTPDWERNVECDLDFEPVFVNDSTSNLSYSSQSTGGIFCFSYPSDSSKIVRPKSIKKYKIMSIYDNNEPFQFSQKIPVDPSSIDKGIQKKLISLEGFSDTEYNQVMEIRYLKSEPNYAVFRVKCKYEMKTFLGENPEIIKPITGEFAFKIRTSKK